MSEDEQLSPVRRALLALKQMQDKVDRLERARTEPIAVVGIGCRLPGGIHDSDALWQWLDEGKDAVTEVPRERWDNERFFDSDRAAPGKISTRHGAFLDSIDGFDPGFFGISPREAIWMDPQHRVLLEVAWEAIEHAGIPIQTMARTQTGVFIGITGNDYIQEQNANIDTIDAYTSSGTPYSFAANRLSYHLDLHGPSLAVDSACSSSLVALHLACQSLRNRDCDAALAGGVNLMISPTVSISYTKWGLLSPDGKCKTFDAAANGFVRGEGCAVVVLKRLDDALAAGDDVIAVVRGSGVNQDGQTTVITAPSGLAQAAVVRKALDLARLDPSDIGFIETHGTGTSLGDPIEVEALASVYGRKASRGACALGAIKTNMGHLEAAAGILGFIKAVLCVHHGAIPRNLHFEKPNPEVPLTGTRFVLPSATMPWPEGHDRRYAGVSSFGAGGTNAHAVLEEPPERIPPSAGHEAPGRPFLLPLSARSAPALTELARRYRAFLAGVPPLRDLAHTAGVRRTHHDHRLALVGRSHDEFLAALSAFVDGAEHPGMHHGQLPASAQPKVVFVFPGQGSQWIGMGRKLLAEETVFRDTLSACDAAIRKYVDWSLLALLGRNDPAPWERVDVVQPTLFAMGVALAAQWRAWGVEPDAVVGHSMGEVAAAHVAGALSLDDAARVICLRSQLLGRVSGKGAMLLVELPAARLAARLEGYAKQLSIAASNGPRTTVVSGDPDAAEHLRRQLETDGIFCRHIKVAVASHSPQMDPLLPELTKVLAGIEPVAESVAFYSTVSAGPFDGRQLDTAYWGKNLRQPVQFTQTVASLLEAGHTQFVEMSPHPLLLTAVEEAIAAKGEMSHTVAVPSFRRDADERAVMLESLGALYAKGYPVPWEKHYPTGTRIKLPSYPWQRQRYWFVPPVRPTADASSTEHSLLGQRLAPMAHQPTTHGFQIPLERGCALLGAPHRLQGLAVLALDAFAALVDAAVREIVGAGAFRVKLAMNEPVVLSEEGGAALQLLVTTFDAEAETCAAVSLYYRETTEASWRCIGEGRVLPAEALEACARPDDVVARCTVEVPRAVWRQRLSEYGIEDVNDPPVTQVLVHPDAHEAIARVQLSPAAGSHALVRAAAMLVGLARLEVGAPQKRQLPVAVESLDLCPGTARWMHLRQRPDGEGRVDIAVFGDDGATLAELRGLELCASPLRDIVRNAGRDPIADWFYELQWPERPARSSTRHRATSGGHWLLVVDGPNAGVASALATSLTEAGETSATFSQQDLNSGGLARALQEGAPVRGVVLLLDTFDTAAAVDLAARTHGASVLRLLELVVRAGRGSRLWLVTCGAQAMASSVREETASLSHAPLWSLGRVIAQEHPELWGGLVDLDPESNDAADAEALAAELLHHDDEDQIAFRRGRRHVARLVQMPAPSAGSPAPIRADGSYLVTGGLGGLGLHLARWLVERGARHVVLTSRTGLRDRSRWVVAAIRALEAAGATVETPAIDAADRDAMARLIDGLAKPLRGVFHAAGDVFFAPLVGEKSEQQLEAAFRPKVHGSWILHELTAHLPLDLFVLFSSVTSLWGGLDQGHYAASNQFLDALAIHRRAMGLPATSIAWGAWAGGNTVSEEIGTLHRSWGLKTMPTDIALDALERVLQSSQTGGARIGVASIDWDVFKPIYEARGRRRLLEEIRVSKDAAEREPALPDLLMKIDALSAVEAWQYLTDTVAADVAQVLGFARDQVPPVDKGFFTLGMDSVMAVRLLSSLGKRLGRKLRTVIAFEYPTIASLTQHLGTTVLGLRDPSADESARHQDGHYDDVTEDELAEQLARRLLELS
ncbi:type I polyketide synthase [Pendulispora rubella]|uniref:Type I polyketide synthase n=1 Tax=Pendulispora rubella TaxID=2741070 RepID=A0ABZ2LJ42_9BACT